MQLAGRVLSPGADHSSTGEMEKKDDHVVFVDDRVELLKRCDVSGSGIFSCH